MMPATDSEVTSMDDLHTLGARKGGLNNVSSQLPPTSVPSSTPPIPITTRPIFTNEAEIEMKAVSMASNGCSSVPLSSPAEGSPAKPAVTSPSTCNSPTEPNPATSQLASASESLTCTGKSLVSVTESPPSMPTSPLSVFGSSDAETDFPAVLTFKGVSVTLENNSVWKQFHSCGTEMILTKQGRRMFPYCRYRLFGLEPTQLYSLVLSIVPSDQYKYRWNASKWEPNGVAEERTHGVTRAFSHHYSPSHGLTWMGGLVSFYKLKLTNNNYDQEGHIILQSMHRYIPQLHVIPVPEGTVLTGDSPLLMGPECMTFTFPQTEFMAVTTYQNFRITQLKINHNPFARGFREEGNNSRLNRIITVVQPVVTTEAEISDSKPDEHTEVTEEAVELSTHTPIAPAAVTATRLVLKPIMSGGSNNNEPYISCIRGKHALGELVLVEDRPRVETKVEPQDFSGAPDEQQSFTATSTAITPRASNPGSSRMYRKRRKRINRRRVNSQGREWKTASASPTVLRSPSLTVAMQPELDDVEGLLFVSFSSKEALDDHVRDNLASTSPSTTPIVLKEEPVEVTPETDVEKVARFEAILLQDLSVFKHKQVIHPELQEVGLKLSCLDPTKSVDLQYLGVHLPLPPPYLPEQGNTSSPSDEGLPFISRTGKTSDMTKIKGWKNKFIKGNETSPNCDGSQKNLSAFCSNMLDEYLETEAQNISERAAAFCTNPEGSVAYQLPATSASYVKTLDSVLKQRETASKSSAGSNRPCPLSHKHLFQPSLAQLSPASQRGAQSIPSSTSSQPGAGLTAFSDPDSNSANSVQQRLCTQQPVVYQRPVASQGQTYRPSVLPKFQSRLLEMENGARNKGLSRTRLTTDRLDVALSVIVTKETRPSQILKVPQYPVDKATGPECGQDFCTLGCMCASLHCQSRGPLHCRRPECIFGCSCFKRKITKQLTPVENEQQSRPVYSVINMEYSVQPRPGTHADTLWKRSIDDVDPEPVFVPRSAPPCLATAKSQEEDKDPVYKYLESMMTCARVRGFNSNPPPEVTIEPKIVDASTPNTSAKLESATTEDLPKMYYRTLLNHKTAEKASQGTTFSDREARKQIEIQSGCEWKKDRKKVLEALCRRLNQNSLPQRFFIRPYCIRLITKIIVRKPSGSLIKYRVHISQPSEVSSDDDEEGENSNEEKNADKDEGTDEEDEDYQSEEEPVLRYGVTPFLSGVLPAGKLRAAARPVGCQANGLIQVNGKSYNQARLLLGNIGALHPANRLAAYVTGRLNAPADVAQKPLKSDTSKKALGTLVIKAASTVVPPTIMARKTTELKMPVHLSQTDSSKKGSLTSPQLPHPTPIINLTQTFVAGQSSAFPFQKNCTSSTVSLTVSPSLKTPSFLGQSGTYSFRICPPANQDARNKNPPTVILPGGFTLIQLPKQQTDGAAQQSESGNSNVASDDGAAQSHAHWLGMGIAAKAKELLSSTFLEPTSDEKTPSEESDDPEGVSEDSESTDYLREAEEEEEDVDVETVDALYGRAMDNVKEAARKAVRESSDGSDIQEPFVTNTSKQQHSSRDDDLRLLNKRNNHTWVERLRRSELRGLFEKLEIVLQTTRKTSRVLVLSKARREIQTLAATSKYLEEQKRKLMHTKNVYMKELSRLTGKSKREISGKLTDYYEGQKLMEKTKKWSPFFSSLLQSRAALLQANNPQSKNEVMPLLQSNFLLGPSKDHPTAIAAQNSADQMPSSTPLPLPSAASSLAQANITAPPAQTQSFSNEPVAPVQVTATPHPPTSQEGASSTPSTPTSNSVKSAQPPNHITLPLIRSKTGRIILPSSLKPICQNFFPIMVMTKGEDGKVIVQPADADSSYNGESGLLSSDQPSDSRPAAEEDKTLQPSDSEPKPSGVKTPLAALALLNKTIVLVPEALKATVENTPTASCSNVSHVLENPAALQPHSSPPIVRRSRGRPRKNDKIPLSPVSPASENKAKEATSQSHGETPNLVEERPKEKITLTKTQSGDNPEPVKRRGRPLKRKSSETTWVPLVIRRGHSPPKPEDGPVSTSRGSPKKTHLNMDRKSSRPLTRGALGKDFPSAKKRSWLDVEKDLEPEDESE